MPRKALPIVSICSSMMSMSSFCLSGSASTRAPSERKPSGGDRVDVRLLIVLGQQVARDLLDDELIERFVVIECTHHVVAITPCMAEAPSMPFESA